VFSRGSPVKVGQVQTPGNDNLGLHSYLAGSAAGLKAGRQDSDNAIARASERDCLVQNIRIRRKVILPERVSQHH